nr:uncharacterized protein LOC117691955 [Crassostrea gigas]
MKRKTENGKSRMKGLMTFVMRYCFLTAKLPLVYMDCDGIFNFPPCCVGEKIDESKQICTKCPRGLTGYNCTQTCEVPYFGHRCVLGRCSCTRDSCNIPPSICSPKTETDVSVSTLVHANAILTRHDLLCNILNRKRHIDSDYELPARVYENNGSTNCYDTPDTNTNISPTQGASESSYEFVEQFRKDL